MENRELDLFCKELMILVERNTANANSVRDLAKKFGKSVHKRTKKELMNLLADGIANDYTIYEAVVTLNNSEYGLHIDETE